MLIDGRLVRNYFAEEYTLPQPWIRKGGDELTPHLIGSTILSAVIEKHHVEMRFANGSVLEIDPGPERRTRFRGNGKPRRFLWADDLRKAVFLSPTDELWS